SRPAGKREKSSRKGNSTIGDCPPAARAPDVEAVRAGSSALDRIAPPAALPVFRNVLRSMRKTLFFWYARHVWSRAARPRLLNLLRARGASRPRPHISNRERIQPRVRRRNIVDPICKRQYESG